jgi:hypothetical protein
MYCASGTPSAARRSQVRRLLRVGLDTDPLVETEPEIERGN